MKIKQKVAIIYRYVPQYRYGFYECLRNRLLDEGVELVLIYGQPGANDRLKGDAVEIPWGIKLENRILRTGRTELYWQPAMKYIRDADLVIVEQANKLLLNYYLILMNILGRKKIAFWGHGKNFQSTSRNKTSELIKKWISSKVFWWFAYTEKCAQIVRENGFPPDQITVVQNAIDTRNLIASRKKITTEQINELKEGLHIKGSNVGLYVGAMYNERKLDFLLESCKLIRSYVHDFEMIFIGKGKDQQAVERMAQENQWSHYVGPKFDDEKIPYFALANVFLMPGSVGLAILDCFALEVPLITTEDPDHGPEMEYLKNGVNGIMLQDVYKPDQYAQAVSQLLTDKVFHKSLIEGCKKSAEKYTLEQMVENFTQGILGALSGAL